MRVSKVEPMKTTMARSKLKGADALQDTLAWLTQPKQWTPAQCRMSKRDLAGLLNMLMMLLENGLSLQRSLEAISQDRACRRNRRLLNSLKTRVVAGESLSQAMVAFSRVFTPSMVHHIALAEASGTLIESLQRISQNLEESLELRRKLIQKLSYPTLVICAVLA